VLVLSVMRLIMKWRKKIQKVGNGGLLVYIPKAWAECHQLKPGDYVTLEVCNDCLAIRKDTNKLWKEIAEITDSALL